MDTLHLLDQTFAWTAARIAAVPADRLDAPTPCSRWDLRELLDHTVGALTMLTDAVAPVPAAASAPVAAVTPVAPVGPARAGSEACQGASGAGENDWHRSITELAARSRQAWQAPGVMDRTIDLPIGTVPAPVAASITLLEAAVHGWDISQASGEAADIPEAVARPTLAFARQAIDDASRGDNFAADLATGTTPSAQLVAYLGRMPQ